MRSNRLAECASLPSKQELETMLDDAHVEYYERMVPKGGMIGWDREPLLYACFVIEGRIEIFSLDYDGRQKILDECDVGEFFGFQVLKGDCRTHATARALEDARLIIIPRDSFYAAIRANGDFAVIIAEYLYGLLYEQTEEVSSISFRSTHQRTAGLLLELAREANDVEAELKIGNNRIANILGVSRNSVTASLALLQKSGVIEKKRGGICVIDENALRAVASLR